MEHGNDADQKSEHKSIGGALVDVFDAGVTLVRSEVSSLIRRLSKVAKAKALGVVLLLAALVPLTLA
ncbi:MAG: phage holin family protein, partial [Deinococcus sp.]